MKRQGLTLIELLSSAAIAFVLSAILAPVIGSAKMRFYRSSSISKLRQVHAGLMIYKADYEGIPYGKASEMGLPTVEALMIAKGNLIRIGKTVWFSPCSQHPDSPIGFTNLNYYPEDSGHWAKYVRGREEGAVLLSDFNCNPKSLSMGSVYLRKHATFVRLDGSAGQRTNVGSVMNPWRWFHDD